MKTAIIALHVKIKGSPSIYWLSWRSLRPGQQLCSNWMKRREEMLSTGSHSLPGQQAQGDQLDSSSCMKHRSGQPFPMTSHCCCRTRIFPRNLGVKMSPAAPELCSSPRPDTCSGGDACSPQWPRSPYYSQRPPRSWRPWKLICHSNTRAAFLDRRRCTGCCFAPEGYLCNINSQVPSFTPQCPSQKYTYHFKLPLITNKKFLLHVKHTCRTKFLLPVDI